MEKGWNLAQVCSGWSRSPGEQRIHQGLDCVSVSPLDCVHRDHSVVECPYDHLVISTQQEELVAALPTPEE